MNLLKNCFDLYVIVISPQPSMLSFTNEELLLKFITFNFLKNQFWIESLVCKLFLLWAERKFLELYHMYCWCNYILKFWAFNHSWFFSFACRNRSRFMLAMILDFQEIITGVKDCANYYDRDWLSSLKIAFFFLIPCWSTCSHFGSRFTPSLPI